MNRVGVKRHEIVARDALDALDGSLRPPAIGMRRAVEHLEQRFDRAHRRVVLVLADRREALGLAASRLRAREKSARRTTSSTIASTSSKSSDRHVQLTDRRVADVATRSDDATIVEFFGERRRRIGASSRDRGHARAGRPGPAGLTGS